MKKTFILLLILVLCVGCTRIDNIENKDLIVDVVLNSFVRTIFSFVVIVLYIPKVYTPVLL